jgi:hypothetical protein
MEVVVRFQNLEQLDLIPTTIGDAGVRRITALKRLSNLRLPPTVTREGLRHLDELPNLGNLDFTIQADDQGPIFNVAGRLTRFVQLDVYGDGFNDEDLAHVAKAPLLQILHIHGGQLSESGLLALKGAPKLRGVSLKRCGIDAAAGARLAQQLAPILVRVSERPRRLPHHRPGTNAQGSANRANQAIDE